MPVGLTGVFAWQSAPVIGDDGVVPRVARPFVGRGDELARLEAVAVAVAGGQPGFAVVGGDAGVGKTRLLEELASRVAAAGHTVLIGSCVQVGDFGLPYAPMIDAFRAVAATEDGAALLRAEVVRRPALIRLFPQLAGPAAGPQAAAAPLAVGDGGQLGEGLAQTQLFEALHGSLLALAQAAPVLLIVEDLHWADRSTRDLLAFLARTIRVGRVGIVASYRADDVHRRHPLRPLLAELARRPDIERIELAPFSRAELAELLSGSAGEPIDPLLLDGIFGRSEGNAFFAEELMRAADRGSRRPDAQSLPMALADVLLTRAEALSADGRALLRVAAVAGRRASHDLLLEAAESAEGKTESALRECVDAALLVSDGETYAFRHALLQEAVYADLLPGERVRLHCRFAELLAKSAPARRAEVGEACVDPLSAELAHHRLASHDLAGAFEALLEAAAHAECLPAPGEALRHLEQALELAPRIGYSAQTRLLERAAEAAAAVGEDERAAAHAEASVESADQDGDPIVRARTRERLARYRTSLLGSPAEDIAAAAVGLLPDEPSPGRAQALATLARAIMRSDPHRADELLNEAIAVADEVGAGGIAADAIVTRGLMAREGAVDVDAAELFTEAVRRAAEDPSGLPGELRALRFAAVHALDYGRVDDALQAAEAGMALGSRAGLSWSGYGLDLRLLRGWALAAQGEWDAVLEGSLDAVYAPTAPGRVLATQALEVLVARGDAAAAGLLEQLRGTGDRWSELQLDMCEIDLLSRRGEHAAAAELAEHTLRLVSRFGETEAVLLAARGASALAELAVGARLGGDSAAAEGYAERARAVAVIAKEQGAVRAGPPPVIGLWIAWAQAEAARAAGRVGRDVWADVVGLAERSGRVPDVAAANLRLAESALDDGDRGEETVAALRRARELAERLGAKPLLARIDEVVRRSRLEAQVRRASEPSDRARGTAHGRPAATPEPILTARESEVLQLLAQGKSNRQIGTALYISEKTASVHVSNIIGKLAASSRSEAVVVARRQGLLPR